MRELSLRYNRVSESLAVDVPVEALFEDVTVRRLAERIDALRAEALAN